MIKAKKLLSMLQLDENISDLNLLKPVLNTLNDLKDKKLIEDYVIGGGIAVMYYSVPIFTDDLDIFCIFPKSRSIIIDPSPVFQYLKNKGFKIESEDRVNIEGIPVQFLVASGLLEEAIKKSVEVKISGVNTKVIKLEYLIANMVSLGRPKDISKIDVILSDPEVSYDKDLLENIIAKYSLSYKWDNYEKHSTI